MFNGIRKIFFFRQTVFSVFPSLANDGSVQYSFSIKEGIRRLSDAGSRMIVYTLAYSSASQTNDRTFNHAAAAAAVTYVGGTVSEYVIREKNGRDILAVLICLTPPLSGFGISAENQIPAKKYLAYYVANGTISLISKWLEDNCYMEAEEFARIIYSYCGALFGIKTAVGQDAAHTIIQ